MFSKHLSAARAKPSMIATEDLEPTVDTTDEVPVVDTDPLTGEPITPAEDVPVVETPEAPSEEPITAEISEDLEGNDIIAQPDVADDAEPEEDSIIEDIESDEQEIEELEQQMRQMVDASTAIEMFGVNPTAIAIMQTTGLLNGTALESIGLESFSVHSPSDDESKMALESLGEKIKEKSAQWSAKILSVVKNAGSKILGVLKPLWDKIQSVVTKLGSVAWDATKTAGRAIKAHPYKTIAAVVASIAVVAGVVAFAGGNFPAMGVKMPAFESFGAKLVEMIKKIKNPFTKVNATFVGGKLKVGFEAIKGTSATVVNTVTAKAAGWSQTVVKVVGGQASRAYATTKDAFGALVARGGKLAGPTVNTVFMGQYGASQGVRATLAARGVSDSVANFAGVVAGGAFISGLISTVVSLIKIAYAVIVGGFRVIAYTFRALLGVQSTPQAA